MFKKFGRQVQILEKQRSTNEKTVAVSRAIGMHVPGIVSEGIHSSFREQTGLFAVRWLMAGARLGACFPFAVALEITHTIPPAS